VAVIGLEIEASEYMSVLGGGQQPLAIGPAEALLPQELAVLGHGDRHRWNLPLDQLPPNLLANRLEPILGGRGIRPCGDDECRCEPKRQPRRGAGM
jgi:hypothetical protein